MSYHGSGPGAGQLDFSIGTPSLPGARVTAVTSTKIVGRTTSATPPRSVWEAALAAYKRAKGAGASTPVAAEAGRQAAVEAGATSAQSGDIALRLLRFAALASAMSAALAAYLRVMGRGGGERVAEIEARTAARNAGASSTADQDMVMAEVRVLYAAAREQQAREQAAREQQAREQAAREQQAREQAARLAAERDRLAREQQARDLARGASPRPWLVDSQAPPAEQQERKFPWLWVGLGAAGLGVVGYMMMRR